MAAKSSKSVKKTPVKTTAAKAKKPAAAVKTKAKAKK